ncbi:MAG: hypothetical protein AAF564_22965 [Bacteroidota bacterium]
MINTSQRDRLLWIDGTAGTFVGITTLLLLNWLYPLYQLPRNIVLIITAANLVYGGYALFVASRKKRPIELVVALAAANLAWMFVCIGFLVFYGKQASIFGLMHIAGEGAFVTMLAVLEWRWRYDLQTS